MRISKRQVQVQMAINGLNIKGLAKKINMQPQNLSTVLVRGTCRPETAIRIASALGVDVAKILTKEE